MASLNPLPFIEGLITAGEKDGFADYLKPEIQNSQILHPTGDPMDYYMPTPDIVSEDLRISLNPDPRAGDVQKFSDFKYSRLVRKFLLPRPEAVYQVKKQLIQDLGNCIEYVNKHYKEDYGARDDVVRGILTALSSELGEAKNRVQSQSEGDKYFDAVIREWSKVGPGEFTDGILKLFEKYPGFDRTDRFAPDIARYHFRADGFIRRTQRFLGDKYASMVKLIPKGTEASYHGTGPEGQVFGKGWNKGLLWDNWTYKLEYDTQTLDADIVRAVRGVEDNDTLDRIAYCVLFSGAANEVVKDMYDKMNEGDEDFFENNVDEWKAILLRRILHPDKGTKFSVSAYASIRQLIVENQEKAPEPASPRKKRKRRVTVVTEEEGMPEFVGTAIPFEKKDESKGGGNGMVVALGALIALLFFQGAV